MSDGVRVHETFFVLLVSDMQRAAGFYRAALGGEVTYTSNEWTSIRIDGVRLGLSRAPRHVPCDTQLHFSVDDLTQACREIVARGGDVMAPPRELAPGIWLARVRDPEGNAFSFTLTG